MDPASACHWRILWVFDVVLLLQHSPGYYLVSSCLESRMHSLLAHTFILWIFRFRLIPLLTWILSIDFLSRICPPLAILSSLLIDFHLSGDFLLWNLTCTRRWPILSSFRLLALMFQAGTLREFTSKNISIATGKL